MNHTDHVNLLRAGIPAPGGVWADLGAGAGAFTLALAELLGPTAHIYALDQDQRALQHLAQAMQTRFPETRLTPLVADFTAPPPMPPLDGIVMANALHFQRKKDAVIYTIRRLLRPGGHFLLVEYDVDRGNPWVPYPLAYPTWERLAGQCGFAHTALLATVPSSFLGRIYSALSR